LRDPRYIGVGSLTHLPHRSMQTRLELLDSFI